jgi:anthranilate synthase/aminodeoxychorismate synthase-like glutamine amidotransferase
VTLDEIRQLRPDHICVSPGPCTPKEAGISCDVIRTFGPSIPLLGVCLGHQSIGHVFGGEVVRAGRLMHGKTSRIHHNGTSVFKGLPDPFEATRYHSLLVKRDTLPDCLEITAVAVDDESEIMGLRHKEFPIHGVQFHPESILTQQGKQLLQNFLDL